MSLPKEYDESGPSGPRHGFGPGKLKVEQSLTPEELAEYEKFARQPGVTNAQCRQWLIERGHPIGEGAVKRHRRVLNGLVSDLRQCARFSGALVRLAAEHGSDVLPNLNLTRLEQVVMQKLCKDDEWHEKLSFDELGKVVKVIESAIDARRDVDTIRREFEGRQRDAAEEAAKAAERGESSQSIAKKLCEMFNVTPPQPSTK